MLRLQEEEEETMRTVLALVGDDLEVVGGWELNGDNTLNVMT
jgi:hypothetical protein